MAFCMKCGQELHENDVFCPNCGAKVEEKETPNYQEQVKNTFEDIKSTTTQFIQDKDTTGFGNKFIKQNNIIGLLGCIIIVIACFLPFASVSVLSYSQSISLMSDGKDGIIFLVLSAITAGTILIKKDMIALIAGIITGGLGLYEIFDTVSSLGAYSSYVTKGAGFYLLLIGSIVLLASDIVKKFILK